MAKKLGITIACELHLTISNLFSNIQKQLLANAGLQHWDLLIGFALLIGLASEKGAKEAFQVVFVGSPGPTSPTCIMAMRSLQPGIPSDPAMKQ